MTQVFISYSRKDLTFVEHLAHDLRIAGLEVWYDLSGLEIGMHWGTEIQDAIKRSYQAPIFPSGVSNIGMVDPSPIPGLAACWR